MTNAPNNHPTTVLVGSYILFLAVWIFLIMTCSSCTTQDKFNRIADKHKDWLASKCSTEFPIDTTSVDVTTDTTKADNIDYSKTIDSLSLVAENALNQVKIDTVYSEKDCNELIQKQAKIAAKLSSSLEALRASYKPCLPSYITKTRTLTVRDSRELYLKDKRIKEIEGEIAGKDMWNKVLLGAVLIAVALIFILKK